MFSHAVRLGRLQCRRATPLTCRFYSTPAASKPSIKIVAELRKATNASINKASEALAATNNDFDAAVAWLTEDALKSGAAKAAKLAGRVANEGTVALAVLSDGSQTVAGVAGTSVRAAMIELGCETDFVGRGALFSALAQNIARTAAYFAPAAQSFKPFLIDELSQAPCLTPDITTEQASGTIGEAILEAVSKLGENITLKRAVTFVAEPEANTGLALGSYVHGAELPEFPDLGRMASLVAVKLSSPSSQHVSSDPQFQSSYKLLRRALARQIVGMNVVTLRAGPGASEETALLSQPFVMFPQAPEGSTVEQALKSWSEQWGIELTVEDFAKWSRGEEISE
ncbi:elongation factor TS-domain-containing protein [Auriculariales sp. MPI-PUGE-AT-0066]|nr:elongation factor TS-domain-containing protein [Auriculariales sp. MPI-PUGE-AT-0066]